MTLREQFLMLCDAYCDAKDLSRSRLSTILMNGGHVIDRVARDGDLTTGSFEKAVAWFSTNWPTGTRWPKGINRPKVEQAA